MRRDEAIEYLEKLIKEDEDLNRSQKTHVSVLAYLAIYSGSLNYRKQNSVKKRFDFLKSKFLKDAEWKEN